MARIDGINPSGIERTNGRTGPVEASGGREAGQPGGVAPADADRVSISRRSLRMATAVRAVQSAPDIRDGRVAEIKAAIARGEYGVDAEAIAERLLRAGLADLAR